MSLTVQFKNSYIKISMHQPCQQLINWSTVALPCQPDVLVLTSEEPGLAVLLAFCFELVATSGIYLFFPQQFHCTSLHIAGFQSGNLSVLYCPEASLSSELRSYMRNL